MTTKLAAALVWLSLLAPGAGFAAPARLRPCTAPKPLHAGSDKADDGMATTYAYLAMLAARQAEGGAPLWIAIAGGPGAGKSTLAEAVAERCCERGVPAVVLPMDGFHYSRAKLCELDPPSAAAFLPRRGAPHTFDAAGLVEALTSARRCCAAVLPTYSRELSDPVPGGVALRPEHKVVLVEGNYLLLGLLADQNSPLQTPKHGLAASAVAQEAARWAPLLPLFNETWFVAPPGGVPEQRRRLVKRHLETWTEAKTLAWGAASAREGAEKRSDFNDVPNAHLVDLCRPFADRQIDSV